MSMRLAAKAACFAAIALAHAEASAAETLTLDDAFARVATLHPDLLLADARAGILSADLGRAALRPPLVAGAQLENAPGTGNLRAVRGAEITLTLASVLERGGKLDARRTLARRRVDAQAFQREARRLDLLAEVARRYLAASLALHQREIARLDIDQRQRAEAAARRQMQAGASPESVVLGAQASVAMARLAEARAGQQWLAARQHLAALWNEKDPAFEITAGDPLRLPAVPDTAALATLLERTPELTHFAGARRIAEARLQLARSSAIADVEWQVGLRHLREDDDFALVAGFALPLGAGTRAGSEIRAANAELAALEIEREASALSLYSTLAEAHGRYTLAQLEVARLRDEVLPLLARAEAAADRAWQAGATGYMDLAQRQSELTAARRQQLETAVGAQRALIEIQRLTGQPFSTGTTNQQEIQP